MKNKGKVLAWVLLYIGIAVALQIVMGVMLLGVIYKIAFTEGLIGNETAIMQLFEQSMGISLDSGSLSVSMDGSVLVAITGMCDFVMLAGFGLWYYFRENKYPFRPDYRKAFTGSNIMAILGIAFFGQFAINLILMLFYIVFPSAFSQYEELSQSFDLNTITPILMYFIVGLLGPLSEELLFRGMIYAKLRRAFSMWPAAIISSVLFGIFHANWVQGVYAAVFGIVLAYIYEKTQTIWGSCLLHVAFNSLSYPLEYIQNGLGQSDSAVFAIGMFIFEIVSAVLVIFLMRHFRTRRMR